MTKWLAFGFLVTLLAPAAPLIQQTGSLTISTEADAEIFWQGISIGLADSSGLIQIDRIPIGSYASLITKSGFLAESTQIRIDSGNQQRQLSLTPLTRGSLPEIPISDSEDEIGSEIAIPTTDSAPKDAGVIEPLEPDPVAEPTDSNEKPVREAIEKPTVPVSDFERPGNIPTSPSTESDLRILIWWGIAILSMIGLVHLFRKRNREDLVQEQESIADFSRALSPTKNEPK